MRTLVRRAESREKRNHSERRTIDPCALLLHRANYRRLVFQAESNGRTESPSTAVDYQLERIAGSVDRWVENPSLHARRMKPKRQGRAIAIRANPLPET